MEKYGSKNEMVHVQFENTNVGCLVEMEIAEKLQNDPVYRSSFLQSITTDQNADDPGPETTHSSDAGASSKMDGCRWAGKEAEALVGLRIESDLKFQMSKTHKKLWDDISLQMKLDHGYIYTGVQCQNKWKSIKREYKVTVDHNAKSGNDRKSCKFFNEFNNLYGNKPSTRPAFVLDTNDFAGSSSSGKKKSACTTSTSVMKPNTTIEMCTNSSTSASSSSTNKLSTAFQTLSSDSDNELESPQAPVSKKHVKEIPGRKRKNRVSSGSGVDKIIGWMNSYQEKQEEMETRRFKFIKKQNKEKLDRLDRLLDIISDNQDNKQDKQADSDSSA